MFRARARRRTGITGHSNWSTTDEIRSPFAGRSLACPGWGAGGSGPEEPVSPEQARVCPERNAIRRRERREPMVPGLAPGDGAGSAVIGRKLRCCGSQTRRPVPQGRQGRRRPLRGHVVAHQCRLVSANSCGPGAGGTCCHAAPIPSTYVSDGSHCFASKEHCQGRRASGVS